MMDRLDYVRAAIEIVVVLGLAFIAILAVALFFKVV